MINGLRKIPASALSTVKSQDPNSAQYHISPFLTLLLSFRYWVATIRLSTNWWSISAVNCPHLAMNRIFSRIVPTCNASAPLPEKQAIAWGNIWRRWCPSSTSSAHKMRFVVEDSWCWSLLFVTLVFTWMNDDDGSGMKIFLDFFKMPKKTISQFSLIF